MTRLPRFHDTAELLRWANRKHTPPRVMLKSEYIALEEQEHFALVQWRDLMTGQIPELRWLFHCPNGEFRTPGTARKLARMGVRPGVSDFLWLCPRGPYHGLALELKAKGGTLSPEQRAFLSFVSSQRYAGHCCVGWDQARLVIMDYYEEKMHV